MNDWTAGYVADIDYTFGYYQELNPLRVRLAFLNAGLVPPETMTACELGFGQGVSINLHAAASKIEWFGTDFNPAQAGFAQELARASGSNTKLYDEAFDEFCTRLDLPDFDYISLHGIWSWISEANRRIIVDFIRRKLKVGGVLYISYNTMPGWAAFAPMRYLLTQHAETIGSEGHGIVSRIDGALDFGERLLATNPGYALANPQLSERLKKMQEGDRQYLAHEYFNRDWHPMHFSKMAEWLEPAKVDFACSANYLDFINAINLTEAQQNFLNNIPDATFRESVRDFMVNQQFRRDYWVKGARKLNRFDRINALKSERVMLSVQRSDIAFTTRGALGEATLNQNVYSTVIDVLADYQIRTLSEIEEAVRDKGINFAQVLEVIIILSAGGKISSAHDADVISQVKTKTQKLNTLLLQKSRGSDDVKYLATPVTGGGVFVGRFVQLFLLAMSQGHGEPEAIAQFVWDILRAQGHSLMKDGKALATAEENLDELTLQIKIFVKEQLPALQALQIA